MGNIGIASTVKTPLSQLYLFVNYHLNIGVDHVVLFFDDPEDIGINSFSDYKQVTTIACTSEYWEEKIGYRPKSIEERQVVNVNQAAEYLSLIKCIKIIHIDCDELLYSSIPIKQVFNQIDADIIKFSVLEAVAEREQYANIFLPRLFKKNPRWIQTSLAKKLGCSKAIFNNEYFRGHTASKAAVRMKPEMAGSYDIHAPKSSLNSAVVTTDAIKLLHFDCVTINEWKMKWDRRLDGTGTALQMRDNRKKQMLLYQSAKDAGEISLSLLFNQMHNIRRRERPVLYILGMLTRVHLDEKLFEMPAMK